MDFDKDLKLALGWNRVNLRLIGVWPEPVFEERLENYKAVITAVLQFTFIILPQSINLFRLNGNLALITENLTLANIPVTTGVLKLLMTWYHREDIKPLLKSFYEDWSSSKTEEERKTMLKGARIAKYISTWCTVLTQVMVTVYLSLRIATVARSDRSKVNEDHLALYPGYFPYNIRPTNRLVLTNLGQCLAAYCATISYTSVDTFIAMLVLHTCGQFQNLRRRLERLTDKKSGPKNVDEIQEELVWIVKRHEHLIWYAKRVEDCFNILLLMQLVFCTIEICLQGFMFFNVILQSENGIFSIDMFFFILFLSFIVVHVYLYCHVGEMLLVQSIGMSSSAYDTNWCDVSPPKAKYLILIMCRTTRPLCLTAGKFSIFSMEMFSTILKTAMGYMSVLLTVSSDD